MQTQFSTFSITSYRPVFVFTFHDEHVWVVDALDTQLQDWKNLFCQGRDEHAHTPSCPRCTCGWSPLKHF